MCYYYNIYIYTSEIGNIGVQCFGKCNRLNNEWTQMNKAKRIRRFCGRLEQYNIDKYHIYYSND